MKTTAIPAAKTPKTPKIESGIPIPAINGIPVSMTDVFRSMKVGQSFLWKITNGIHTQAHQAKIKIATRKQPGGLHRVWRVK